MFILMCGGIFYREIIKYVYFDVWGHFLWGDNKVCLF